MLLSLKIGSEVAVGIGAHGGEGHVQFGKDLFLVFVLKIEHAEMVEPPEEGSQRLGIALGRFVVHGGELLQGVELQFVQFVRHKEGTRRLCGDWRDVGYFRLLDRCGCGGLVLTKSAIGIVVDVDMIPGNIVSMDMEMIDDRMFHGINRIRRT